jgi:mono/diheme cytochrome c family protein
MDRGNPRRAAHLDLHRRTVVAIVGFIKFYVPHGNPPPNLTIAGTSDQIVRGEHIAITLCVGCHSKTDELPLSGGLEVKVSIAMDITGSYEHTIHTLLE